MSFSVDISNWVARQQISARDGFRRVAKEAVESLIQNSPAFTGNFRSQWKVGINSINTDYDSQKRAMLLRLGHGTKLPPIPPIESYQEADKINSLNWGDFVSISNQAPYGPKLNARNALIDRAVIAVEVLTR